jgi:hypothetical protein
MIQQPSTPLIIGFGYKARQGKDTAIKTIIDHFGDQYDIRRYAFGDELKREVNELDQIEWCFKNGIPYDFDPDMTDPLCQSKHGKQGKFLQWYGTEYRRAQDPFYWVKRLRDRLRDELPQIALIADTRFQNEFLFVLANKGYTVKVVRTYEDGREYVDMSRDSKHISENELAEAKFNFEIRAKSVEEVQADAIDVFGRIIDAYQPMNRQEELDAVHA